MLSTPRLRIAVASAASAAILALPAAADPAMWLISDGDSEIYLFGTVHILPPELEWRSEAVRQAFDRADTVWFEAPAFDAGDQLEVAQLMLRFGTNPPGQLLSGQISSQARSALESITPIGGLALANLEPFRPWLAAVTLTAAYVQSQGYDPDSGVESVLFPMASKAGKKFDYFESLEEQVRFFADLPAAVEAAYFEQTVLDFQKGGDQLERLVSAWASADIGTLDMLMNSEWRESAPDLYQTLLLDRNTAWVSRIRAILAGSGAHFIALGAGHFVGPQGVIALLRAEGIQVAGP